MNCGELKAGRSARQAYAHTRAHALGRAHTHARWQAWRTAGRKRACQRAAYLLAGRADSALGLKFAGLDCWFKVNLASIWRRRRFTSTASKQASARMRRQSARLNENLPANLAAGGRAQVRASCKLFRRHIWSFERSQLSPDRCQPGRKRAERIASLCGSSRCARARSIPIVVSISANLLALTCARS